MRELSRTSQQLKDLQAQITALQKAELKLLLDQKEGLVEELKTVEIKIASLAGALPAESAASDENVGKEQGEGRAFAPRGPRPVHVEEDLSPLLVQGRWPACVSFGA